jgi:hypothetical protein
LPRNLRRTGENAMPIDFLRLMRADPISFLATNIVRFFGACAVPPGGLGDFRITSEPGTVVRYRTGSKFLGMGNAKATGQALLARAERPGLLHAADDEVFRAVWSGYQSGGATHCTLPAAGGPDVMLTPMLSGCTVTWQKNGDGSARFGHYNDQAPDRPADRPETLSAESMQMLAAWRHGTTNDGVMSKEYYYDKAKRPTPRYGKRTVVNAFGVRLAGGWEFFTQYIEAKGTTVRNQTTQIRGVEQLTTARWYNLERY